MTPYVRLCITMWFVFSAVSADTHGASQRGIASVRLSAAGHPHSTIGVKWDKQGQLLKFSRKLVEFASPAAINRKLLKVCCWH